MPLVASAQQRGATVHGTVADPDEAVIPGATVTLTPASGKPLVTQSQSDGTYVLHNVPAGTYSETVTMQGFASFVKLGIKVNAGQSLAMDAKMDIQAQQQEVQVTAQSAQVSVDADSNASATVIKGKDLDALSDDPDELSSELTALAGPSAGPNGGQIYVDGFTGGQLPPKSSIREIRINQNPFSAEFDKLGYGRVQIFTKPGTDKLHGFYQLSGNTSSFNSGNPLLNANISPGQTPITQPPYHTIFMFGDISGPLSSNASFTMSGSHRSIQDNSIVNATILSSLASPCPSGQVSCSFLYANPTPNIRTDISPRIDVQLGEKNTLTTRFRYEDSDQSNQGVLNLSLPQTAYNASSSEITVQMTDTQVVSSRVINETRFEYERDHSSQNPLSTGPSIVVQGNFTDGGSANGTFSDNQTHFELHNYTSIQLQKHFIRMGGRLRSTRDAQTSDAGSNGTFTYNCLLTADCAPDKTTGARYSFQSKLPSQFVRTNIKVPSVNATMVDLGVYAEDDWKPISKLTFSYGIRYETQNRLGEHHDIAPRLSFAYGLWGKTPKTVLRGGFGIFYDRYDLGSILTAVQLNGVNQQQTTLAHPDPATCSPTNLSGCTAGTPGGETTVAAASNMRTPYSMEFAIGADQQLFNGATLSVNYLNTRGVHQFLSQNINAPTLDSQGNLVYPTPPTDGSAPAVIKQYQSEGVYRQNELIVNPTIRKRNFTLFGYYVLNFAKSDTGGINSFPSQPYNIGADYGRATFDRRNRLFLGGNVTLPYNISLSPFIIASSGTPYNVTLGQDLNNDSIFNDRPAFGAANGIAAGQPGSNTIAGCGSFVGPDPNNPTAAFVPIPINYCTGPALFVANIRASKTFGFGPSTRTQNQGGPGGGDHGGHGGHGGPGGGGRGFRSAGNTGKKYNVTFSAQVQNLFNNADYATPNSSLGSAKLFGKSTQLAGGPYTSSSSLRRISLNMSFNF
ncbi:MAG TPA: carboxypeptidase regulatory-like domain-containing protein [Edaphobacter sp.]|uniref:TonB-dependent receptor n=1 Tax=Edaphobacter sp. TaxID=1934404 RepID=UPI002CF5C111|nr:carboxypeptidase regulatory-like domain-containing protein [Edaphobacter sp.]HUZ93713.1 carboxypeptidase regulatory-like domain-containing protein [Edaphobacter sp.]